jgi:DNA-binding XRE family transcriptional regulator
MITRIRELLETRQLTPTQFADLIGVGRPVISHILSERNKPSLEVVQKIIGAFPDVSLPWLLTGTGSMQASAAPDTSSVAAPVAPPAPVAVQPAAPTIIYSPAVPQVANNPAPIATSASRPAPLPLPPKFRPGAKAASQAATASPAPVPTAAIFAASVEVPAPAPVAAPIPEVAVGPTSAPAVTVPTPPAPTPAPTVSPLPAEPSNLAAADNPIAGTPTLAQTPLAVSRAKTESAAATTNQAAALSFLGEPGKAIRRIVIFYRDGSFSDYVPEGF